MELKRTTLALVLAAVMTIGGLNATADETGKPAKPVVLLELYTSQGCYSCPPAEKLLHEKYVQRDDIMPLEFHVDYWDTLIYGFAGSWKDPFSNRLHSERQIAYNKKLRNTRNAYTPQMIVHGRQQGGGAQEERINGFIQDELVSAISSPLHFYFEGNAANGLTTTLDGILHGDEQLYYVVYWLEKTTIIPSGENKGKTLTSSNIVKKFGARPATERQLTLPVFDANEQGCAVWVQKPGHGAVVAAARCPTG